jgi:hypothetical protein
MSYSKLVKTIVFTSKEHSRDLIVTAKRVMNDTNGNPRYLIQTWSFNNDKDGALWTPQIKGYRFNEKLDGYVIQSYNIDSDLDSFIIAFERTVYND